MNLNQVFLTLVCSSFMYVTFTVTSCSWLNLCGLISVKILMQPPLINLRYKKKLKSDSSSIIMFQTSTNFISFLSFRSSLYNKNNLVQSKSTDANVVDIFFFFFLFSVRLFRAERWHHCVLLDACCFCNGCCFCCFQPSALLRSSLYWCMIACLFWIFDTMSEI